MSNAYRPWAALVTVMLLIGCASPAGTLIEEVDTTALEEETPAYEELEPTDEPLASEDPYLEATPAPVEETVTSPVVSSTPVPTELVAHFTKSETSGVLWWKKVTVAGEVYNPTAEKQSGVLKVEFLKNGNVVETRGRGISSLAPGETVSFEYKSDRSAEDAQLIVTTD